MASTDALDYLSNRDTADEHADPRPARQPCACCGASLVAPTDPQQRCPTCQYSRCCPAQGHRACGQLVREETR